MKNDGSIDLLNFKKQGAVLNKSQEAILIVSSGAVACGKTIFNFNYIKNDILRKRILSSVGNPILSQNWQFFISDKVILQSLLTHRDLILAESRKSLKNIISHLYQKDNNIIQVNDNDFITDEELKKMRGGNFGDNDEITSLLAELCSEIFSEIQIIVCTGTDGVLANGSLLREIRAKDLSNEFIKNICNNKSSIGTGGMENKLKIFRDLVLKNKNIKVKIINGKDIEQIKQSLTLSGSVGTTIWQ